MQPREVNTRTRSYEIQVDWSFVQRQGHQNDSIPVCDEIVLLSPFSKGATSGLAVEVSNLGYPEILDMAISAENSVPKLEVAGVDFRVSDLREVRTAYAIEISTASAGLVSIRDSWHAE